ncbi:ATP-binding protein [Ramlibacter sp.]|uniref:sensor histidine kinase n=1 Tax=Ramlibacter sp. TaxID=1917967 RepID=UPI00260824B7|nr:ATP-binding protein [Ramlibacter sp.]
MDPLLTLTADWYWEQDAELRFTSVLPPERAQCHELPAVVGRRRWERPHARALTMSWEEHRERLLRHLSFHDFQYSVATTSGQAPLYISTSGAPMFDRAGSFVGYRGIARDITAQWQERGKLQEAEALLDMASSLGRLGAWSIDVKSGMVRWTAGVRAIHRMPSANECAALELLDMYAPEYGELLLDAYRRCVTDGVPFDLELEALAGRGERSWVRLMGVAVRDHAGEIVRIQGAVQDIHRSKTSAEAQRQMAERFRVTLDSLTDAFGSIDRDWRITYVNPAALAMLKLDETAVGRPLWDVFPQARDSVFGENYRACMERREVRRFEAFFAPLGMWLRASAFPSEHGISVSLTDITAAREACSQLERMNGELDRRVRERTAELKRINEELALFTLSLAHDLRAPLTGISSFSVALEERIAGICDEKGKRYLSCIQGGIARMEELIEGLLELSRIGRAGMAPRDVDLTTMAREVVEALSTSDGARAALVDVQEGLRTRGDACLLHTLVENLLGNAWKFSAGRNPACITVGQQPDGTFFVRDNGAGFDMARADALFAPFTRLHDDRQFPGLGIGLASARRVVERHGGRIWAESQPDRGSTFFFTLMPQAGDEA